MERTCGPMETCDVCGLMPFVGNVRRSWRVIAESPPMQRVLQRAAAFAASEAPVVVLGESGTGKEVVARVLHANCARAAKPFVAVNVAALPGDLLESELFGHARGAFTGATTAKEGLFEAASGGTLFLDEIAEMPLALQSKLLRALQDGEVRRVGDTRAFAVDVRIVCATHRDLSDYVARGLFREDLYYRLNVLTLHVPPLRDRREDIAPLAAMFLAEEGRPDAKLTSATRKTLEAYPWPGNVRQLGNAMKHGVALSRSGPIDVAHLPEDLVAPRALPASKAQTDVLRPLADVEREHVLRVLDACRGSQTEAAKVLGIGRNTLWRKLGRYE